MTDPAPCLVEQPPSPPLLAALEAAHAALDTVAIRDDLGRQVGWVAAEGMTPEQLSRCVRLQAELEGRVAGMRLHTVAAADAAGAPEAVASPDTPSWAASAGRNRARSWGGIWLASHLESKYAHTRAALARGRISEEHAAIIVRAGESAPEGVDPAELADCEERMVAKAEVMSPRRLRRAVRRLLEPISKRLADQHEGEQLAAEEHRAERESWMTLWDNEDGTWGGKFVIPELHGNLLKNALETLSGPRRHGRDSNGERVEDVTLAGFGDMNPSERLGAAFLELLEHLPADGHTKTGVTLVVHVDEEVLREQVGAATLETGARISHEQVRRLACEAGHLPLLMKGRSLPLDLGSSTRLYSKAQRIALSAIYDSCAAVGCERPFAWCELHHRVPWSQGGPTDLTNAAPLCGYHHRRVHDTHYEHQWLSDGQVRFRHRWASRRKHEPWEEAAA